MNGINKNIKNISWLTPWLSRVFVVTTIILFIVLLQTSLLPVPSVSAITPAEAQCLLEGEVRGTGGFIDCVNAYTNQGLTAGQFCEGLVGDEDVQAFRKCLDRFIPTSGSSPVCYANGSLVSCPAGMTGTGCYEIPADGGAPYAVDCALEDREAWVDTEYSAEHDCNGVAISIGVTCEDGVNPIYSYVTAIINFLSAGVGIVVVTMVAIGGVQYMTAGGNPQATQAAVKRISNALIALVVFIFIWAFLNWIIPGNAAWGIL